MRLLALSTIIGSTWLTTSCVAPEIRPGTLLGNEEVKVRTTYYQDFIGVSSHGELFEFQECSVDTLKLNSLLKSNSFQQFPDYSEYKCFYENKLSGIDSSTWKRTPVDSAGLKQAQQLFIFNELQEDAHSGLVIHNEYLRKPGSYFAYYAAYPVGSIFYILTPAEGKLYIFRKRG